ncbi:MAG: NHLP family bacteriocin export ABC transporter peptidase/permease/ATPase subunit [Ruminiclostridium sp.]|nr:NHLP family bacteriocin export ABC transporter peptidase/permease/ATPase subunit [Ruminiclostridium sp.]
MEKHATTRRPLTQGVAKVPVVMQQELLECGAACLAMVMAYYEKWVPLEQVRSDCGVSRDGTKAKNVLLAARHHGFTAKGFRLEPENLRAEGPFPCIIHWNFDHFVVLCGFRGNRVVLNDPARGRITVSMEEFDVSFTGICLTLEPGEDFVPSGHPKRMATFLRERLRGFVPSLIFVMVTALITALVGVISAVFSRVFLDRLLTGRNPEWFLPFMVAVALVFTIQVVASGLDALYRNKLRGKMDSLSSASFFWKVLHMPIDFFSQRLVGDIQGRQTSNAKIAESMMNSLAPLVMSGVMILFYLVVMLHYSLSLTLIGVTSLLINAILGRYISKKRVNVTRVLMRDAGMLDAVTVAGVELIETIKASGAEDGYFSRWAGYQASVNTQRVKYLKLDQYLGILPGLVLALCNVTVLILGVWYAIEGSFTAGMVMAFQGFLTSFSTPATHLMSADQNLQEMRSNMERVDDVMEYPDDPCYAAKGEDDSYAKLRGKVELRDVTFGYSPLGQPVIKNFSMTLEPGKSVALVGPSGCGKSTISKLISGLHQPWSGEILFDGKPQSRIDRNVFTGSVAVVDQEITLFEDTIANNIKMWDTSIEDFEMILAARDAGLHQDIMQREGGYYGQLRENGIDLSGGQRQRMEIARVLAQDPTIIVMDEATSMLDAKTEFEVANAIRARGITLIVVAHRLSTIRDCDEIIVLDRGEIAERGTHDELFARNGLYTQLVISD